MTRSTLATAIFTCFALFNTSSLTANQENQLSVSEDVL